MTSKTNETSKIDK